MKKQEAINLSGSAASLAELLNITPSAVAQWGDEIPSGREWQLRVLRPEWFAGLADCESAASAAIRTGSVARDGA